MFKFARQQSEEGEIGVVAHFVGIMIRNGSASSHISHAGPHEAFGYSEFVSLNTHSLFFMFVLMCKLVMAFFYLSVTIYQVQEYKDNFSDSRITDKKEMQPL